jgi:hypothetical protein
MARSALLARVISENSVRLAMMPADHSVDVAPAHHRQNKPIFGSISIGLMQARDVWTTNECSRKNGNETLLAFRELDGCAEPASPGFPKFGFAKSNSSFAANGGGRNLPKEWWAGRPLGPAWASRRIEIECRIFWMCSVADQA